MFISEVLCYIIRKYGNSLSSSVKSIIVSFYSANEIVVAKELLFKVADDMNVDGLPRLVSRRKSDDKAKQDVDE